jgi:hypothetical protein
MKNKAANFSAAIGGASSKGMTTTLEFIVTPHMVASNLKYIINSAENHCEF